MRTSDQNVFNFSFMHIKARKMKSTTILAIVAIIAVVGAVASVPLVLMAPQAHAGTSDYDDRGHGKSFHDRYGDIHSDGKESRNCGTCG